jgi:hypothetical protein
MMQMRSDAVVVHVPAPTAWPMVLACGITLMGAGLVTSAAVTVLGVLFAASAAVGWFRNVLPSEVHDTVIVEAAASLPVPTSRRQLAARLAVADQSQRAWLPLEIYPVSAGLKGGLAGGVVMALLAMTYGMSSGTSIWYPVNLLAAGLFPRFVQLSTSEIAEFHRHALLIATAIHLITSVLVGVLYGVMLPMLPRRPIVLGGLVAPIFWSALVHSILGVVNPVMNQRIDWPWFVLSQIGFGIVAGVVVSRQERVRTLQLVPLAARAGLETPGLMREREGDKP